MKLNRKELRKIQYDFNSCSNRLLQANYEDYADVLGKGVELCYFMRHLPRFKVVEL